MGDFFGAGFEIFWGFHAPPILFDQFEFMFYASLKLSNPDYK